MLHPRQVDLCQCHQTNDLCRCPPTSWWEKRCCHPVPDQTTYSSLYASSNPWWSTPSILEHWITSTRMRSIHTISSFVEKSIPTSPIMRSHQGPRWYVCPYQRKKNWAYVQTSITHEWPSAQGFARQDRWEWTDVMMYNVLMYRCSDACPAAVKLVKGYQCLRYCQCADVPIYNNVMMY